MSRAEGAVFHLALKGEIAARPRLQKSARTAERARALVPASPSVETAAADQKHDDNDDEKGGHIHDDVPFGHDWRNIPTKSVARPDARRVDYFFKASRKASLTPPTAF